jgi:hypothetical protein
VTQDAGLIMLWWKGFLGIGHMVGVVACRIPKRTPCFRTHAGHRKSAKGLVGSEGSRFPFRSRRVGECLEAIHGLVRICARSLFKDAGQLPDIVCEEALLGGSLDRVFDEILGEPLLTCARLVRYFSDNLKRGQIRIRLQVREYPADSRGRIPCGPFKDRITESFDLYLFDGQLFLELLADASQIVRNI